MYNYSIVNIETSDENVGGIGGQDNLTTSSLNSSHNIYLGNMFNKKMNSSFVHRIIGSNVTELYNFAYRDQLINGSKSDDIAGCTLLNTDEILSEDIYYDESVLGFGENFNYSELSKGILPKLNNNNTGEILPNQKDIYLREDKLAIDYLEFSKGENVNVVNVAVEINNPNEVPITGIEVDSMNVTINTNFTENGITYITFTGTAIYYYDNYKISKIKYLKNGIEDFVNVEGFIDARLYKEINNFADWESIDSSSRQNYRLMVDLDFSGRSNVNTNLSIGRLDSEEEHTISGLTLTFSGNNKSVIKEITKSIKNITFTNCKIYNNDFSQKNPGNYLGLLGKVSGDIENIKFSNIEVKGQNLNRVGLIARCSSVKINHVKMNDIIIMGRTYVGGFSGIVDSGDTDDINATDINITSTGSYTGGIYGYSKPRAINNHTNFIGERINITTTGNVERIGALIGQGKVSDSKAIECNVNGYKYVGGLVGIAERGVGNNNEALRCNVTARNDFAGGLFGYASENLDMTFKNLKSNFCTIEAKGNYAGGVLGYLSSNMKLNNVYVDKATIIGQGKYVGGVFGYQTWGVWHSYMYVTNSEIYGKSDYIGGIAGYANGNFEQSYVNNVKIHGEGTNSSYVGGIAGTSYSLRYTNVNNNCEIIATGQHVGGITGYIRGGYTVQYSVCENSTVQGKENVGGIAGTLRYGQIQYCHTNCEIIATTTGAGGIVGYLDNTNNYVQEIAGVGVLNNGTYIYGSAVLGATITANNSAGGLIGKEYQNLLTIGTNFQPYNYYYNNYIDANVNTTTTGTKYISIGVGSNATDNRVLANTYIYKYSKLNGEFIYNTGDIVNENNYLVLSNLNVRTTYIDKLKWTNNNNIINTSNDIISNYYPKQSYLTATYTDDNNNVKTYYDLIKLPNETEITSGTTNRMGVRSLKMMAMKSGTTSNLPKMDVYCVDVDKINLEFSRSDENVYFNIIQNDLQLDKTYLNENNKVFTLQYDFKEPFQVIISNDVDTNVITIDPQQISKKESINNSKYYYLSNDKLYLKDTSLGEGYLNLYNGKVLKDDSNIYNLENMAIDNTITNPIEFIEKKAFVEYKYNSYDIKTYKNFTEVINGEITQERDLKIFVKNNKLFSLNNNLNIKYDGIILDYYNQNEYETVLGTDGVLYDLKNSLKYPKDFQNSNIESITNNLFDSKNVILIRYNYGKIYVFNYVTGEELYNNGVTLDISLKDYIVDKIKDSEIIMSSDEIELEYQNALSLKEKLEKLPISEFIEDSDGISQSESNFTESTISTSNSNNYISVYNPEVNSYVIYNEDELLNSEKPVTENSKIQASVAKTKYYLSGTKKIDKKVLKGSTIVFTIIGIIFINLFIINKMNKVKKKLKRNT